MFCAFFSRSGCSAVQSVNSLHNMAWSIAEVKSSVLCAYRFGEMLFSYHIFSESLIQLLWRNVPLHNWDMLYHTGESTPRWLDESKQSSCSLNTFLCVNRRKRVWAPSCLSVCVKCWTELQTRLWPLLPSGGYLPIIKMVTHTKQNLNFEAEGCKKF